MLILIFHPVIHNFPMMLQKILFIDNILLNIELFTNLCSQKL